MPEPRERFAALCALEDDEIDVAEAALVIAAEDSGAFSVEDELAKLDALAERARAGDDASAPTRERVLALNRLLFEEDRFDGSAGDYYDPRNSFLNEVLERRRGIPITLSILYVAVARRLGLDASGVGFPSHFLVRVEDAATNSPLIVDAFGAQLLDPPGCMELLRNVLGPNAQWDEQYLRPASVRETLVRVLTNLKHIYTQTQDFERTLACCDRILLLTPDAPLELRDRGLVYQKLDCPGPALADLERFLALAPDHESAAAVRRLLETLRERVQTLH